MFIFKTTPTVVLTIEHLFVSFQGGLQQIINIDICLHNALDRHVFLVEALLSTDVNNWLQNLPVWDVISAESHPSAAQSRWLNCPTEWLYITKGWPFTGKISHWEYMFQATHFNFFAPFHTFELLLWVASYYKTAGKLIENKLHCLTKTMNATGRLWACT